MRLPVSVIITTKNEAQNMARCLGALSAFDEVMVVDSKSTDDTIKIAQEHGARTEGFTWNGQYPKKRQWCLENLNIKHDFVFFVDADEVVTPELAEELRVLDFAAAGYFVRGRYVFSGRELKHGLMNNKLCLINRHKIEFPVIDDLGVAGMGEIEGHYQPVLKSAYKDEKIAQIKKPLLHYAYEDEAGWNARHERYAHWQVEVERRKILPSENNILRRTLKVIFKTFPCRPVLAFVHCYLLKNGFLDGRAGLDFARSRYRYYRMIEQNR